MSLIKKNQSGNSLCEVTFNIPAEYTNGAKSIQVLGDFNGWNPAAAPSMKKTKNTYSAQIALETGASYQFRYLLDGQTWINDAQADGYVAGPFGAENSVLDLTDAATPGAGTESKPKKVSGSKTAGTTAEQVAIPAVSNAAGKGKKATGSK